MLGKLGRLFATVVVVIGLIVLQFLTNAAESTMRGAPALWGLAFVPSAIGIVAAALALWQAGRPRRPCPRRPAREGAAA